MPVLSHPMPAGGGIDPEVVRSIRQASRATHVDFGFLMAQAAQESSFQTDAKAAGSSATGLYQFIDTTWLRMVQQHGAQYGIGALAQQITVDDQGRPHVADPAVRQQILALRTDPKLSADLAAEYAKENKDAVERALGRPAQRTDLYMAHFLGAGGAAEFLKAVQHNGNTVAADVLPEAAAANQGVFYDQNTGTPRTVAEIYRSFAQRIEAAAQSLGGGADPSGFTNAAFDPSPLAGMDSANPGGSLAAAIVANPSSFLSRFGLGGNPLSEPMLSMMNSLALAALKLIQGDRGHGAAPTIDPALAAPAKPLPSVVLPPGPNERDSQDI
jgi:hypothetical protein